MRKLHEERGELLEETRKALAESKKALGEKKKTLQEWHTIANAIHELLRMGPLHGAQENSYQENSSNFEDSGP